MASIVEFENPPTPEAFRHAMEANGVAKISGLLPARTLADLQTVVDRSYAAIDRRIARGEPIDAGLAGDFRLWNGINNKLVGPLLVAYEPELAPLWSTLLPAIEASFTTLQVMHPAGQRFWRISQGRSAVPERIFLCRTCTTTGLMSRHNLDSTRRVNDRTKATIGPEISI